MRYIKTYKIFENYDLISKLDKYEIENYTINDDNTISVNGDVYLMNKLLTEIPFLFGNVNGHFSLYNNELTNLRGCPIEIGGDFICPYNKLTSLEFCPSEIGRDFTCSRNKLTSLEYCPSEIGRDFNCSYNQLTMLDCSSYVKGNIYCEGMFNQEPEFFGDCEGKIIWKY